MAEEMAIVEVSEKKDYAGIWKGDVEQTTGKDFTTFASEDFDEMIAGLVSDSNLPLAEAINTAIDIENVYIENAVIIDKKTGEQRVVPRMLLYCKDGNIFYSTSVTAFNSLGRIFRYMGMPSKQHVLTVVPKKVTRGDRQYYTFVIPKKG